jgi:cytochrome c-type biogenesis protein
MEQLFSTLSGALHGAPLIAAGSAFLWGILSIVLSPCHLSSIPLIIAFIGKQGTRSTRRAFILSAVFAGGILVTIALVGLLTAALGRMLGDVGRYGNYAIAVIFFLLGLHFLGVIPLPWSASGPKGGKRKGLLAAFLLGLFFGLGVGPCTFAFMAPMLAVAFKVATQSWIYAVSLLLLYGLGHCAVIVAAGTSAEWVQRYLQWHEQSKAATRLRQVCGVLIIFAGLYLIYTAR